MRGKGEHYGKHHTAGGITPAYAGKSVRGNPPARFTKDHPRLCGEKALHTNSLIFFLGSPPPMRGKGMNVLADYVGFGITPAYAGKSGMGLVYTQSEQDHPRLCGEKCYMGARTHKAVGSPPPMRGKASS